MDSILTTIKKLIGDGEAHTHFDVDLIIDINSALSILSQLGVGPPGGFSISDDKAKWTDFITVDDNMEMVKSYVHLKTKLLFDPPTSNALIESMNRMISEFEWRIAERVDEIKQLAETKQNV